MKQCTKCLELKPDIAFTPRTDLQSLRPWCRVCESTHKRDRSAKRKVELDKLVPRVRCLRCCYDRCQDALERHHINPTDKSFVIADSWHKPLEELVKEAKKCIVLCANCHAEFHAGLFEI